MTFLFADLEKSTQGSKKIIQSHLELLSLCLHFMGPLTDQIELLVLMVTTASEKSVQGTDSFFQKPGPVGPNKFNQALCDNLFF